MGRQATLGKYYYGRGLIADGPVPGGPHLVYRMKIHEAVLAPGNQCDILCVPTKAPQQYRHRSLMGPLSFMLQ